MSFNDFYFIVENGIQEIDMLNELSIIPNWRNLDPRRITNVLRKIGGTGRTKIIPKSYETFEVEGWGFQDLFNKLTDLYNAKGKEKKKFYIKGLKQGVFNPKDAHPTMPDDLDSDDINIVSVYNTNNGGTIILYALKDEEGEDVFYIGLDGKAQKYFAAEAKKGGLGMLFKAWLNSQRMNKNIFSSGMTKDKPKMPIKVIDRSTYEKLVPVVKESINEKEEATRAIFWDEKDETWKRWAKNKSQRLPVKPKKGDYEVNAKTGEKSTENIKRLQRDIQDIKSVDKKDTNKNQRGELYQKLKNELEEEPRQFDSKNIEIGWVYELAGGNVIYVYKSKDGEHKLSWKGQRAKDLLVKFGYIEREDIKKLK